jgi:hypothetical protein
MCGELGTTRLSEQAEAKLTVINSLLAREDPEKLTERITPRALRWFLALSKEELEFLQKWWPPKPP